MGWGGDPIICLASLPSEILRNWVKVYHVLGLGHLGSEIGTRCPGQSCTLPDVRIQGLWHVCLSLALTHSEVEDGSGSGRACEVSSGQI